MSKGTFMAALFCLPFWARSHLFLAFQTLCSSNALLQQSPWASTGCTHVRQMRLCHSPHGFTLCMICAPETRSRLVTGTLTVQRSTGMRSSWARACGTSLPRAAAASCTSPAKFGMTNTIQMLSGDISHGSPLALPNIASKSLSCMSEADNVTTLQYRKWMRMLVNMAVLLPYLKYYFEQVAASVSPGSKQCSLDAASQEGPFRFLFRFCFTSWSSVVPLKMQQCHYEIWEYC